MPDRDAQIESLPLHQRPSPRELGRRSEAADHPFKAMRPDEGGSTASSHIAGKLNARIPLVTSILDRQKMVLAACDPVALSMGLTPGMAVTHARALVPNLDVRDADLAGDRAFLHRLTLFALQRWTPTAMADDDGVLFDLTGVSHLHGGEEATLRRIVRFCERLGLAARIAVAGTIGAAHALARYGRMPVTICDQYGEPEALADLPIACLRLEGNQRDAARRLGLERVGDLFAMPRGPLARRLGISMIQRLDQAIGRVPEPFDALEPFVIPEVALRFAEPIGRAEDIAMAMGELVDQLTTVLRQRGLGTRRLRLVCERVDRAELPIGVGMARPSRDPRHLLRLLSMKIEKIDPGFGIDTMRLVSDRSEGLPPEHVEGELTGEAAKADIALLIDQIAMRLGERAVFRSSSVESDVPERSVRRVPPLSETTGWPARWPRPPRLLRRPEALEGVIALLPDQPPKRFSWRGTVHFVFKADGPERITGEWWKRVSEAYAVRDYFRLENDRGERFWVFRRGDGEDPQTGDLTWYMHGFFG